MIRRFAPAYVERYGDVMTLPQRKALTAILQCRTEAMGGRVCACEGCGATRYAGYSCGHSACSQCGSADTEAWVANQLGKLINVPYFMVTFTLPRELRRLMWRHAEVLYPAFFAVSSQCLRDQLACRENGLGTADSGFFGIMHTWTQLLRFHPHIHFIVPGVGFREDGRLSRGGEGGLPDALGAFEGCVCCTVQDDAGLAGAFVCVSTRGVGEGLAREYAGFWQWSECGEVPWGLCAEDGDWE